jgi:hypothetical protein
MTALRVPVPDALRRLRSHPMAPVGMLFAGTVLVLMLGAAAFRARDEGLAAGLEVFARAAVTGFYVVILFVALLLAIMAMVLVISIPARLVRVARRLRARQAR